MWPVEVVVVSLVASAEPALGAAVRLRADALPSLLVGKTLKTPSMAPPDVYDANYLEHFGPHGAWRAWGGRASSDGAYRFVGDQVCVSVPRSQPQCRWILRDGHGNYYTEQLRQGRPYRVAVTLLPTQTSP